MSLTHAILGLLNIQPMTGYDLKHLAFDQTVAHFWQADQAQIYRTLARSEAEGWVHSRVEVQTDRPNKRVYTITEAGRAELLRWLRLPQSPPVYREPFLVQLFFGGLLPVPEVLAHIQAHIEAHQSTLAAYEGLAALMAQHDALDGDRVFWRMTLDLGIALEHTYLHWLEACQQQVRALPGAGGAG